MAMALAVENLVLMGAQGMPDRVVCCSRMMQTLFSATFMELSPIYILLVAAQVNIKGFS